MVPRGCTKVYYYLDSNDSPYMSVVPVPLGQITLGDFKRVFDRRGYNYFCRVFDPKINCEVKQVITNDEERLLPAANGLIELFLLSGGSSAGTLPKTGSQQKFGNGILSNLELNKRALSSICDEFDQVGGQRVSMVTADPSTTGSFFSKRAGEHLADPYTSSASEDPYLYRVDENTFLTDESSDYRHVSGNQRQRHSRKGRYRKPYVPSTICSQSESSYSLPGITEVKLHLKDQPLGLAYAANDGGVFICNIEPGSAADRSPLLDIGDQVLQVDGNSFEHLSTDQCMAILKKASTGRRDVVIVVAKRANGDARSDTLSALCETIGVDVSLWVEQTKQSDVEAASFEAANGNLDQAMVVAQPDELTSDEECAAYEDRRNGIGAHFVPMIRQAKQLEHQRQQHIAAQNAAATARRVATAAAATTGNGAKAEGSAANEENGIAEKLADLTVNDPPAAVVKLMARPDSGLQVKDRKWLKIPIPMSFIGHELVNWLMDNVRGFPNRKQARQYAHRLLESGLIRHAVNMSRFSEKCYYKFEDKIAAERQRLEQQQKLNAESPTEITYMSGPSSPRLQQQQPQRPMAQHFAHSDGASRHIRPQPVNFHSAAPPKPQKPNGVVAAATNGNTFHLSAAPRPIDLPSSLTIGWPVSPIVGLGNNQRHGRDCESPTMTNDYASMINADPAPSIATQPETPLKSRVLTNASAIPSAVVPLTSSRNPISITHTFTSAAAATLPHAHAKNGIAPALMPKPRGMMVARRAGSLTPPPNTPNTVSTGGSSLQTPNSPT